MTVVDLKKRALTRIKSLTTHTVPSRNPQKVKAEIRYYYHDQTETAEGNVPVDVENVRQALPA